MRWVFSCLSEGRSGGGRLFVVAAGVVDVQVVHVLVFAQLLAQFVALLRRGWDGYWIDAASTLRMAQGRNFRRSLLMGLPVTSQ